MPAVRGFDSEKKDEIWKKSHINNSSSHCFVSRLVFLTQRNVNSDGFAKKLRNYRILYSFNSM